MADHVRKQLVDAVKTAVTNLTTTGARVFGYGPNPLQEADLPGLCVYAEGDTADAVTIGAPVRVRRQVEVHVVGYAASNSALDATLELIGKEVETALAVALTVGGKPVLLYYRGCDKVLEAGEKKAGSIDMTFSAPGIFNLANAPDVFS